VFNTGVTTFTLTNSPDFLDQAASDGVNDLILASATAHLQAADVVEGGTGQDLIKFAAGGTLTDDQFNGRYWRVLDALGFAPDAEKVAG